MVLPPRGPRSQSQAQRSRKHCGLHLFSEGLDAEVRDLLGDLVLQHFQSSRRVARHENAPPRGEEVAYEVCDGVRLPCSWRSLYQNALVGAESLEISSCSSLAGSGK
jgi:hypothetical protein